MANFFRKIILTDFFTTVGVKAFFVSLVFLTIKLPFLRKGRDVEKLEIELLKFLDAKNSKILSFYNGRTAIFQALKIIGIKKGDEIIINGYNCIAVVNSVIQVGGIPVYVDINKEDLSFDLELLKSKIGGKTRVIILQHTFGKTASIREVIELAKKYDILVIEDTSHSMGSIFDGKKHGIFGDFSIFSTGRDKVVSGVNGGFLLVNNEKYFEQIEGIKWSLKDVSRLLVIRNLLYNVFGYLSYKTYSFFGFGKFIIFISRKLHLINEILDKGEKECEDDKLYYKLPNSLAKLALNDFKNIKEYTKKRREIAKYYDENLKFKYFKKAFKEGKSEKLNYFRYPIVFENENKMLAFYAYMRENGVLTGITWSKANIVPKGVILAKTRYNGDCEEAEELAKRILFLPNTKFMAEKDVKRVVKLSNKFKT